ncbi:MAG: hypothetical protein C4576_08780 [Desulfobacteraceae bacterium]|nr:MAG: hypothetical protein C4576_08780 [Desulfobacteraceae bacterium]
MPHDLMKKCEQKKLFKVEGRSHWRWTETAVSVLPRDTKVDVRCMHCHGAVRVHKQQVEHGPEDHVEHRSRQDSESCKGGIYFKGTHRMSQMPVE